MSHEEIVKELMSRHMEIDDYIISMNFLNSVEEEFSVDYPFLFNKSFEILLSLCEDIGIYIFNDEIFENTDNALILSDIYLFLLPDNFSKFLVYNKEVKDLLKSSIDQNESRLLNYLFESLQTIFIYDENYKIKYDLIYWNLTNNDAFVTYVSNILRMSEHHTEEHIDVENTMSYINTLKEIKSELKGLIELNDEYSQPLKVWINALFNYPETDIFGWYLRNKNNLDNNKFLLEDFEEEYKSLKSKTPGYEEYYVLHDIPITEKEINLMNLIDKFDPFNKREI